MRERLGLLVALLLAVLVYAPVLDNGFSLDDYNWLQRAAAAAGSGSEPAGGTDGRDGRGAGGVGGYLAERESGQLLNPVPRALLLLAWALVGSSALPLHVALLVLHLLNVALVWQLARSLAAPRAAFVAAVLFGVHPGPHEAVFWLAAFFHPLCTSFVLSTLILLLEARESGVHRREVPYFGVALGAAMLALLTKAVGFALLPGVALYAILRREHESAGRSRRTWWFVAGVWLLGVSLLIVNLLLGVHQSYLLERGLYGVGWHWLGNLWLYAGGLGFPFEHLAERFGLGDFLQAGCWAGAAGVSILLVGAAVRSGWRCRWLAGLVVLCLLPVLPFVLEPVSRYLYLAAAPFALLVAIVATSPRRDGSEPQGRRARLIGGVLLGVFCLGAWAEVRLVDNHYEFREQRSADWLEQIVSLLPSAPAKLVIVGLPTLAIDPGIHLEAALRLHWEAPDLRLEVVPPVMGAVSAAEPDVAVLSYSRDGRFRLVRR